MFQVRTEKSDRFGIYSFQLNLYCEICREVVDYITSEELFTEDLTQEERDQKLAQAQRSALFKLRDYFPSPSCEHYTGS